MQLNTQKADTIIKKINFLFQSIRQNAQSSQQLEVALLKQYALSLYDTIIEAELGMQLDADLLTPPDLTNELSHTSAIAVEKFKKAQEIEPFKERKTTVVDFSDSASDYETEMLKEMNEAVEEEADDNVISLASKRPKLYDEDISTPEKEEPTETETPTMDDSNRTEVIDLEEAMKSESGIRYLPNETPSMDFEEEKSNSYTETGQGFLEETLEGIGDENDFAKTEVISNIDAFIAENTTSDLPAESIEEEQRDINDAFGQIEETPSVADKLNQSKASDSFNISFNQRYAFINELFGGDTTTYEATLSDLNGCNTIIEAFAYINLNVKMKYKWDDNNPTTREFQDIIKDKFLG